HHQLFVARPEVVQLYTQLIDDAGRIEMQQRRHPIDVDVPAAPVDDVFHLAPQGAANDERGRAHLTPSRTGNPSTEMNESLKSDRPESSTYSIRDGSSNATWRSEERRVGKEGRARGSLNSM